MSRIGDIEERMDAMTADWSITLRQVKETLAGIAETHRAMQEVLAELRGFDERLKALESAAEK